MQKVDISLSIDSEKMEAMEFFLKKENTSVKSQMDKAMKELYERSVPEAVREYLDGKSAPASNAKRSPRTVKQRALNEPPIVEKNDDEDAYDQSYSEEN